MTVVLLGVSGNYRLTTTMSDEFDKEAEREKLRERFEEEQKERESTQVMSDLLLKGATMTNKHCNECGDPVFRQNGQEFCPSCHGQEQHGEAQAADDEPQEASAGQAQSQREQPQSATQGQQPRAPATGQTAARQQRTQPRQPTQQAAPDTDESAGTNEASPARSASEPTSTVSQADGLTGARNRLAAAIETHADRAIETTDPRDATEHLEAARTAAEALATLRRQE